MPHGFGLFAFAQHGYKLKLYRSSCPENHCQEKEIRKNISNFPTDVPLIRGQTVGARVTAGEVVKVKT